VASATAVLTSVACRVAPHHRSGIGRGKNKLIGLVRQWRVNTARRRRTFAGGAGLAAILLGKRPMSDALIIFRNVAVIAGVIFLVIVPICFSFRTFIKQGNFWQPAFAVLCASCIFLLPLAVFLSFVGWSFPASLLVALASGPMLAFALRLNWRGMESANERSEPRTR
jgi:hypothetical protein